MTHTEQQRMYTFPIQGRLVFTRARLKRPERDWFTILKTEKQLLSLFEFDRGSDIDDDLDINRHWDLTLEEGAPVRLTATGETADLLEAVREVVRLHRGACGTVRFNSALGKLSDAWMKAMETHDAVGGSGS